MFRDHTIASAPSEHPSLLRVDILSAVEGGDPRSTSLAAAIRTHPTESRIEGNWKQFGGSVKEKWGKLTDDDLAVINGRRDQLEGKIQERYGIAKDQVRSDVDTWLRSLL